MDEEENETPYKLVAIGCGRSGTTYFADLLNNNGIDAHHERLGPEGGVGWTMITRYEYIVNKRGLIENLLHLVRNPIDAIPSMATNHNMQVFIELNKTVKGICLEGSKLEIAASVWVEANKWCAEHTGKVVRIESIIKDCADYGVDLDINAPPLPRTDPWRQRLTPPLRKNPRQQYTKPPLEAFHKLFQWSDILEMGNKYGYDFQDFQI